MSDTEDWIQPLMEFDPELAENMGWFMIAWGGLEHTIDMAFPVIFRIDPTLATCITANLGTKPKVEMLQSAVAMVAPLLPPEPVNEILDCLAMTLDLSSKYRNFIAHGRPIFGREDNGDPYWMWGRFAARKQLTMFLPDDEADDWRVRAVAIQELTTGIFDATEALYKVIREIPLERWEDACEIRHTRP